MAGTGRCARVAGAGILLIALVLPATGLGAAARSAEPQREPKPYAMLLAGLGLILFTARRRTKALSAGG